MKKERILTYRGKKIIVTFSVDRCTHVSECLRGAPKVFDVSKRPWVRPDTANPDRVAEVILRCPTGALHFERIDDGPEESVPSVNEITLVQDGPLYIRGNIEVVDPHDQSLLQDTRVSLCRCGISKFKPLCDGAHFYSDFKDDGQMTSRNGEAAPETGKLTIKLIPDGPLMLKGPFVIKNHDGAVVHQGAKSALCRCGASQNRPFCDGNHAKIGFKTEESCDNE